MPQTEISFELRISRCDEALTRGYIKLNFPHAHKEIRWSVEFAQVLPHDYDGQLGMHVWLNCIARLV